MWRRSRLLIWQREFCTSITIAAEAGGHMQRSCSSTQGYYARDTIGTTSIVWSVE